MTLYRDMTKRQRRLLRELAGLAYERDLAGELTKVEQAFGRWRSGEMDAFDLEQLIHRFHQGPARELFTRYQGDPDWSVSHAIVRGILTEAEVEPESLELVRGHVTFLRRQLEREAESGSEDEADGTSQSED